MSVVVSCHALSKRYGEVTAIEGIDLQVERGEIFGLLGPNGAGKTTTVKILCTLLCPTSGKARICDLDVVANAVGVRRRLGYVSQERMSDIYMTGRENLLLMAHLYHLKPDGIPERVADLLKMMQLQSAQDRLVRHYSGGMKKKLEIAGGLIHSPEVLFLDEPSLGLDVPSRHVVWDYIRDLKRKGVTIFLCSNYMDEAEQLCDRVAIINAGRLQAVDTVDHLKQEVGGEVVRLTLEGTNGLGVQEAVAKLPFVSRVISTPQALNVFVRYDDQVIPRLLRAASDQGVQVRSFEFSRPTLDDVFLKYTGQRIADAPAPEINGAKR